MRLLEQTLDLVLGLVLGLGFLLLLHLVERLAHHRLASVGHGLAKIEVLERLAGLLLLGLLLGRELARLAIGAAGARWLLLGHLRLGLGDRIGQLLAREVA